MAGYNDTKNLIIEALMGRQAGTEIQPEKHQAYALNMLDYVRSVELVSSSTLVGLAEESTVPVQPDQGKVCYIAGVGQDRTVTFSNFIDDEGNPISITTGEMEGVFVILLWNMEHWVAYTFNTNIISSAESANFYYGYNIRKTYASVAAMNADSVNPIGTDGRLIKIGELVTVVNSTTPAENGYYSYEGSENGWRLQSGFNFEVLQTTGTDVNRPMSQKAITDEITQLAGEVTRVNPFLIENIELYKPDTLRDTLIDIGKAIKSVSIKFTDNFRKSDGSIRRLKIRSLIKDPDTNIIYCRLDSENINDNLFSQSAMAESSSGVLSFTPTWGHVVIEFNTQFISATHANTVATWEQGGFKPDFVERAYYLYEHGVDIDAIKGNISSLNELFSFRNVPLSLSNEYIANTGSVLSGSSNWRTSQDIIVAPGDLVKYIGDVSISNGAANAMWGYDDELSPVKMLLGSADYSDGIIVTIPPGVTRVRGCTHINTELELKILKQDGFSTTSKKVFGKSVRWVGHSIWWYDGNVLYGTTDVARGYQTLLKEQFSFISESKYCYSGYSLGGLTSGDTSSILNKANLWTATAGDIWTLDSITNDFKRNIPIGIIADYENNTGITTFYGALRVFKDKVVALSGADAIVICSNALRRNNVGYTSTSANTEGHTLIDYEKAMLTIAVIEKWYFVDQYRLSGVTDDNIMIVSLDGLHVNNMGYQLAVLPWIQVFDIIYNKLL